MNSSEISVHFKDMVVESTHAAAPKDLFQKKKK